MTQKTDMFLQLIDNQQFTWVGGGKTHHPNLCFLRFHLKNDSILRLTFCRAAFGVQSPKGSPLSLSKWRMEKEKIQRHFDRLSERQSS